MRVTPHWREGGREGGPGGGGLREGMSPSPSGPPRPGSLHSPRCGGAAGGGARSLHVTHFAIPGWDALYRGTRFRQTNKGQVFKGFWLRPLSLSPSAPWSCLGTAWVLGGGVLCALLRSHSPGTWRGGQPGDPGGCPCPGPQ